MKTKLLIAVALLPVVVVADLESILHLVPWYLVWFGCPLIGVVLIIVSKIRKQARISPFGVGLALAGVIGAVAALQINLAKVDSSRELGDRVFAVLEQHKASAGSYPESLSELVPKLLDQEPVPTLGVLTSVPFVYSRLEEGRGCELGFFSTKTIFVRRGHRSAGAWSAVVLP